MLTILWIDPDTRRVAHFAQESHPAPARVTLITPVGRFNHELAELIRHPFPGALPDEMLPQVCWLYKLLDGNLALSAKLD